MAAIVTTSSTHSKSVDAAHSARAKRDEVAFPEPDPREPHDPETLDDEADDLYDNVACTD